MQVTSLLSRAEHEHDESCVTCGHDHEHAPVRLWQTLVGVVFVLNAFIVDWAFDQGHTVASASGLIGAFILGYPIVWTAIKDIRTGILSINELVAIAVLAAFATGEYKTAGVVAFFMLHGRDHRDPHRRRRARLHRSTSSSSPPRRPAVSRRKARMKSPRKTWRLAT